MLFPVTYAPVSPNENGFGFGTLCHGANIEGNYYDHFLKDDLQTGGQWPPLQ